ncbi:thioredoxin domain-containing protein 3 homolog isoform X2 [Amphiura filiformis]|uniref:thioredoxin domain-containing protein 3 homolog isoform X2 n=1 Tax=Amphiura filiformis TaxID=82378 RepID=UPI003B2266E0
MPAKREQIALQEEIGNQEQWDDLMIKENMIVVDIYQKWCGPCKAVVSLFRRLKNEVGDDLLKFAVAECDGIEALEKYRGHCEPCFLFFSGGQLVEVVRGARGPVLAKAIAEQLAAEHRVQDEGAERKVIKDPMLAQLEDKDKEIAEAEDEEKRKAEEEARKPVPKEVTVVLIKPDAVKEGKVDEIKQKIQESGFDILTEEERILSEDEAKDFYKDQEGEEHYESLVQFMSGGPSHVMVLTKGDTGEGVVHEIRALIGPKDIEVAKEEAPDSLRALYGTDKTMNALHGADSGERAARELSFFFPEFVAPIVPGTGPPPKVQKTLALIRPEALKEHKDSILQKIQEAGFEVCLQKEVQLTEEQAKEFYKEQEGTPHFEDLIREMTVGPVLALGLAKEEAVQGWRKMLGPKEIEVAKTDAPDSMRAQFSLPDSSINALHGSDNPENAEKELGYFFPVEHTLAVIKPDAVAEHKDVIIERIKEAGFNIACQKEYDLPRDLASQLYKEHEGTEFYDNLLDHMSSGPSTVMVLSREDAISGWRTIMGPTDPEVAKEQAPESLRALLGKDVLQNAIHGSSTAESAQEKIKHLFPEVEIKEDGQLIGPGTDAKAGGNVHGAEGEEQTQDGEAKPEGETEKTEEQGQDEADETDDNDATQDEGEEGTDGEKEGEEEEEEEENTKDTEGEQETENDEDQDENDNTEDDNGDGESDVEEKEQEDSDKESSEEDNQDDSKTDSTEAKEEGATEGEEKSEEKPQEGETKGEAAAEGEAAEKPAEGSDEQKQEETPAEDSAPAESKPEEEGEAKADDAKPADGEETKTEEQQEEAKPEGEETKAEEQEAAKPEGGDEAKPEEQQEAKTEDAKPEEQQEATPEGEEAKADEGETKPAEGEGEEKKEVDGEKKEEAPAEG